MSDNSVTIVGNITDDPELRFTPSGKPVCNFTVAVNARYKEGNDWKEKLDGFFRCSCWQGMAENVAESIQKGSRVVVTGKINQRTWEDTDGKKRSTIEIQADDVGVSLKFHTARPEKAQRSG